MESKGLLKFLKLDNIAEHLSGYVEDRIELLKLELQEDVANTGAKVIVLVVVLIAGLMALLFASMALSIILNDLVGNGYGGFLIVAGVYLLLTVVMYLSKDNHSLRDRLYQMINKKFEKKA